MRLLAPALVLALLTPSALRAADFPGEVRAAAQAVLRRTGAPSASVAVVQNGRLVLAEAYGFARLDPSAPAQPQTRYAVGSISKEFTAAAILLLEAQGRLSLDDHVAKWFPYLTRANDVTIRQLLTHTSGYSDYYAEDYTLQPMLQPVAPDAIIRQWGTRALDFEPGEDWQYSNTGYVIAGRIVELVSGEPLFDFLKRTIFQPLHMDGVVDQDASHLGPPDATGYVRAALGPARPARPEGAGWMFGAGELAMPARDLAIWDASFMARSLFASSLYERETTSVRLKNGRDAGYGLGLAISKVGGCTVWSHGGEVAGFVAENRMYPDQKSAVVVLTNIEANGAASRIADRIAELILPPDPIDALVRTQFRNLQNGRIDRRALAPNLDAYFTPETVADFASSLAPLGRPDTFERRAERLRGGMTFRLYRLTFGDKTLTLSVYVTPDGKLEQYLIAPAD